MQAQSFPAHKEFTDVIKILERTRSELEQLLQTEAYQSAGVRITPPADHLRKAELLLRFNERCRDYFARLCIQIKQSPPAQELDDRTTAWTDSQQLLETSCQLLRDCSQLSLHLAGKLDITHNRALLPLATRLVENALANTRIKTGLDDIYLLCMTSCKQKPHTFFPARHAYSQVMSLLNQDYWLATLAAPQVKALQSLWRQSSSEWETALQLGLNLAYAVKLQDYDGGLELLRSEINRGLGNPNSFLMMATVTHWLLAAEQLYKAIRDMTPQGHALTKIMLLQQLQQLFFSMQENFVVIASRLTKESKYFDSPVSAANNGGRVYENLTKLSAFHGLSRSTPSFENILAKQRRCVSSGHLNALNLRLKGAKPVCTTELHSNPTDSEAWCYATDFMYQVVATNTLGLDSTINRKAIFKLTQQLVESAKTNQSIPRLYENLVASVQTSLTELTSEQSLQPLPSTDLKTLQAGLDNDCRAFLNLLNYLKPHEQPDWFCERLQSTWRLQQYNFVHQTFSFYASQSATELLTLLKATVKLSSLRSDLLSTRYTFSKHQHTLIAVAAEACETIFNQIPSLASDESLAEPIKIHAAWLLQQLAPLAMELALLTQASRQTSEISRVPDTSPVAVTAPAEPNDLPAATYADEPLAVAIEESTTPREATDLLIFTEFESSHCAEKPAPEIPALISQELTSSSPAEKYKLKARTTTSFHPAEAAATPPELIRKRVTSSLATEEYKLLADETTSSHPAEPKETLVRQYFVSEHCVDTPAQQLVALYDAVASGQQSAEAVMAQVLALQEQFATLGWDAESLRICLWLYATAGRLAEAEAFSASLQQLFPADAQFSAIMQSLLKPAAAAKPTPTRKRVSFATVDETVPSAESKLPKATSNKNKGNADRGQQAVPIDPTAQSLLALLQSHLDKQQLDAAFSLYTLLETIHCQALLTQLPTIAAQLATRLIESTQAQVPSSALLAEWLLAITHALLKQWRERETATPLKQDELGLLSYVLLSLCLTGHIDTAVKQFNTLEQANLVTVMQPRRTSRHATLSFILQLQARQIGLVTQLLRSELLACCSQLQRLSRETSQLSAQHSTLVKITLHYLTFILHNLSKYEKTIDLDCSLALNVLGTNEYRQLFFSPLPLHLLGTWRNTLFRFELAFPRLMALELARRLTMQTHGDAEIMRATRGLLIEIIEQLRRVDLTSFGLPPFARDYPSFLHALLVSANVNDQSQPLMPHLEGLEQQPFDKTTLTRVYQQLHVRTVAVSVLLEININEHFKETLDTQHVLKFCALLCMCDAHPVATLLLAKLSAPLHKAWKQQLGQAPSVEQTQLADFYYAAYSWMRWRISNDSVDRACAHTLWDLMTTRTQGPRAANSDRCQLLARHARALQQTLALTPPFTGPKP